MSLRWFQVIRTLHRSYPQMVKRKSTPGAGRQLEALESAQEFVNDPEAFGDFESDFMHLNKTHRQHETELEVQREQIRHIIVKQKYFKEPQLPNFLLYAEKEEIRTLHARDPEEWTIEKLAESFPATPEIIKKVVDSKWRPYTLKRIHKHDEAVIRNWENLRNNKENDNMHLPTELREHLAKFAKRTLQNTATEQASKISLLTKLPTPKRNEFTKLITSCKKYAETEKAEINENIVTQKNKFMPDVDPTAETYLIEKIVDKRNMRLQELQQNYGLFKTEPASNTLTKNVDEEKVVAPQYENPTGTGFINKFESNEIVVSAEDKKKYEITAYKEQIYIPRKLWRKGGTYRVDDCYYDDDGEFLYRVPGMMGIKTQNK